MLYDIQYLKVKTKQKPSRLNSFLFNQAPTVKKNAPQNPY